MLLLTICCQQKASAEELRQLESRLIQAERQKDLAQLEGKSLKRLA